MSDDDDLAMEALLNDPEPEPESESLPKPKVRTDAEASARKKELAKELWERLAKSRPGPDIKDLLFLARFVPLLSSPAAKTLLTKKLNLDQLKELIQYVPKAKDAAVKLALKMSSELDEDDIRFIFTQSKSPEVGKYLLKKYPNDANIGLVDRTIDELKDLVEEMKNKESTKNILREIDRKL